ncbi:MAG: SatD family protein [Actinomycetota bacterium]|nr:SatD family protein [Actinomycetota bacterium]
MTDNASTGRTTRGVVLIGDVVGSRRHADRAVLQRRVRAVLASHAQSPMLTQHLEVTLGDEFQAATARVSHAVRLCLDLRLDLLPDIDVRFGIGVGSLAVFDATRAPMSQDGPAWWAARKAIETTRRRAASRSRSSRTWIAAADQEPVAAHHEAALTRSFLILQDHLLAVMSSLQLSALRESLAGTKQAAIAEAAGVSQSAVSQALSSSGGKSIVQALRELDNEIS